MTVHSLWDVQAALYGLLSTDTALTNQLAAGAASVMDHARPDTAYPYVVIGDMSSRPLDTQEFFGNEMTANIQVYSRTPGYQETKDILAAIYDALHNTDFTVENQTLIFCYHIGTDVVVEGDGETRRGVMRFRIATEPSE